MAQDVGYKIYKIKHSFYFADDEDEDHTSQSVTSSLPNLFLQANTGSSSTSTILNGVSTNALPATLIGTGNFKINLVWDTTVSSSTFQTAIAKAA